MSAGTLRYVHRIGRNKQKKTLILYTNGTKRPPSALVSSAENTVHTHQAPKKRDPQLRPTARSAGSVDQGHEGPRRREPTSLLEATLTL